jgi:hypothetical protein
MIHGRRTFAKAFTKDVFFNQERKLEDRRRLDTVVVSTINDADSRFAFGLLSVERVTFPPHSDWARIVREIKVFGLRGEYGRKTDI